MSKKIFYFSAVIALAVVLAVAPSLVKVDSDSTSYTPRSLDNPVYGASGMQEYFRVLRRNVNTGLYDPEDYKKALKEVQDFAARNSNKSLGFQWIEEGPDNVGGRTRTIMIEKGNSANVWTGGVSGALWKSENSGDKWERVAGYQGNVAISCIIQSDNGNIYVGTGNTFEGGGGNGDSGFDGDGMWFSTDNGTTFTAFPGSNMWGDINDMVARGNTIWAATGTGLRLIDAAANTYTGFAPDVQVSSVEDIVVGSQLQAMIAVGGNGKVWVSTDGGATFTNESAAGVPGKLPPVGGRAEAAISPDDNNYMYVSMVTGGSVLQGVYKSIDMGTTWASIAPGGSSFDPFNVTGNPQGRYDHCISVRPGNREEVWVGGIVVFAYKANQWEQQTLYGGFSQLSVHPDIHEFQWSPNGQLYIGTDGGVYRSFGTSATGFSYYASNRGLNITQFYEIDFSKDGNVVGGTQDNGTQYIYHQSPNSWQEAVSVFGGDGFACAISHMDPDIMFVSSQNGAIARGRAEIPNSSDFSGFYDGGIDSLRNPDGEIGTFYTEFELFENPYDPKSFAMVTVVMPDTVMKAEIVVIAPGDTIFKYPGDTVIYWPGEKIPYTSNTNDVPFIHFNSDTVYGGDTLYFQDPVQSIFAAGFTASEGIWITRDAMQFSKQPIWFQVANSNSAQTKPDAFSSYATTMTFSAPDGNHLYVGTGSGGVYRISNLDSAYFRAWADVKRATHVTTCTKIFGAGSQSVTGIAVDPSNPDHVVISLGGYGTATHIYETTNARNATDHTSAAWSDIHGSGAAALPKSMPCYDVEIDRLNGDIILVGTEFGVFGTKNGGVSWTEENVGMDRVPTFTVKQQYRSWNEGAYNPGMIYLGTHGRGAFRSETLLAIEEPEDKPIIARAAPGLKLYPNPVRASATVEFNMAQGEKVQMHVFDLQGKVVMSEEMMLPAGTQKLTIDTFALQKGTYFVNISSESINESAQMIVVK